MKPNAFLLHADARRIPLRDESVQCVVTSPPYWGLRDYGLEPLVWGGEECEHEWGEEIIQRGETWGHGPPQSLSDNPSPRSAGVHIKTEARSRFCFHCSAWRGSLGLEPSPDLYVQHLVEIFREVRRVLRKDGTCWVNLGGSYATHRNDHDRAGFQDFPRPNTWQKRGAHIPLGLKPKDLVGMPWRVAFALQADGWWLRSDIIWAKPNPMPESVTDRPTKAHEYLFLLTKSERYYYDAEAVKEQNSSQEQYEHNQKYARPYEAYDQRGGPSGSGQPGNENNRGIHSRPGGIGRNLRSVWTIATEPFPELTSPRSRRRS